MPKFQYEVLDGGAAAAKDIRAADPPLSGDEIVKQTIQANFSGGRTGWIYKHNVSILRGQHINMLIGDEIQIVNVWAENQVMEDAKLAAKTTDGNVEKLDEKLNGLGLGTTQIPVSLTA